MLEIYWVNLGATSTNLELFFLFKKQPIIDAAVRSLSLSSFWCFFRVPLFIPHVRITQLLWLVVSFPSTLGNAIRNCFLRARPHIRLGIASTLCDRAQMSYQLGPWRQSPIEHVPIVRAASAMIFEFVVLRMQLCFVLPLLINIISTIIRRSSYLGRCAL